MNHSVRREPPAGRLPIAGRGAIARPVVAGPDAAGTGTIAIHRPAEVREAVVIARAASPRAVAADPRRGPCRF